jgi:Tol biopolymer transport system component
MTRIGAAAVAVSLVVDAAGACQDAVLLTIVLRDSFRSRADPSPASVSADGRYIAFVSYARLVTADSDVNADVYVLDRVTNDVTLESVESEGLPFRGDCGVPRISGDGRYVAFDAVVMNHRTGEPDIQVMLRDRTTGTARWISRTPAGGHPNGSSGAPAIAADGSVVVFTSSATDLAPGIDANGPRQDVYAYGIATGTTTRVSLDSTGSQHPEGNSAGAAVSGSGRYVAFESTADLTRPHRAMVVPRPPARLRQVYVRDLRLGATTRISTTGRGDVANGASWGAEISADGDVITFVSLADNLVPHDRNRAPDVFVHDRRTGVTTLVSRSASRGTANGSSSHPAVSGDGRFVVFQSDASDLVCASPCDAAPEDYNLVSDVFVADRRTGAVRHLSGGPGDVWMEETVGPAVDSRGDVVVFASRHPTGPDDVEHDFDLFVRVVRPFLK